MSAETGSNGFQRPSVPSLSLNPATIANNSPRGTGANAALPSPRLAQAMQEGRDQGAGKAWDELRHLRERVEQRRKSAKVNGAHVQLSRAQSLVGPASAVTGAGEEYDSSGSEGEMGPGLGTAEGSGWEEYASDEDETTALKHDLKCARTTTPIVFLPHDYHTSPQRAPHDPPPTPTPDERRAEEEEEREELDEDAGEEVLRKEVREEVGEVRKEQTRGGMGSRVGDGMGERERAAVAVLQAEGTLSSSVQGPHGGGAGVEEWLGHVEAVLRREVSNTLQGRVYSARAAREWPDTIARECLARLSAIQPPVRWIVHVVIAERRGAGLSVDSGCQWDRRKDAAVAVRYDSRSLRAVVTAYSIHF